MTLLWAALVSVATTLVVEWFAKPTLEARKERILEQHRTRRRIVAIALDDALRTEDHYLLDQATGKPELADEYRSLRAYMKPLSGKRNREALVLMDSAIKGPFSHNTDPIRMSDISYFGAQFLNEPVWHFRKRNRIYAKLTKTASKDGI